MRRSLLAISMALVVTCGLVDSVAAQAEDAEAVLERLERAINAKDETTVVALFADDGRIVHDGSELAGPDEVRDWLRAQVAGNLHIHLGGYSHANGVVRFNVEAGAGEWYVDGAAPRQTTGTAHVKGGRIVRFSLETTALPTPVLRGTQPSVLIPTLGLVGLVGAFALGSRLRTKEPAHGSAAPGSLMAHLDAWTKVRRRA